MQIVTPHTRINASPKVSKPLPFNPAERPDPPSALEVIEIGSRSIKLSWNKAFDGNSPIREYIIQYQPVAHGILEEDWEATKTHNISHTPGSYYGVGTHPTSNGNIYKCNFEVKISFVKKKQSQRVMVLLLKE